MWYIKIFFLIQFFVFTGGNFFSICLVFLCTYHKFIPKLFNRKKNLPFPGKENMSNFLKIQDTAYLKVSISNSMMGVWGYRILRYHFQQELWRSFLSFTFSLAAEKSNTGLILGLVGAYSFSLGTLVPFFCPQCFETFHWCVLCGFVSTHRAGQVVNPSD